MKVLISGYLGFMGREVKKLCLENYRGCEYAFGVDINADGSEENTSGSFDCVPEDIKIDCIVDFSHHAATPALLEFAKKREIPLVLATTGHDENELSLIHEAAKSIPLFYSRNMSLGIALLIELAKITALAMPDAEIEIIESHHNRKLDAPSGTALMIADTLCEVRPEAYTHNGRSGQGKRDKNEIGIHAIRMGNIVGIHEVIVGTKNQTITLKHEAHDRALFAEGGLSAAAFLVGHEAGLYDMSSLIGEQSSSN